MICHRGADVFAQALRCIGVRTVFCYPGGANLELLDALSRVDMELVRTEHEQGAVFGAQGYARASGQVGVCLATSGPGATNMVTGIADANSDSIPVLAVTGNVATHWLGKNAFQEVDIVSITKPITKLAVQVRRVDDVGPTIVRGARLALEGRPGPVLVDIPKDIQQADASNLAPIVPHPLGGSPVDRSALSSNCVAASAEIPADMMRRIAELLAQSRRPVIYAGGGVIASGTGAELLALAEAIRAPVVLTLMGLGGLDIAHPLCLGPLGMHGAWCANVAINEADLVLALGVRFDDRVIGDPSAFARHATIVHIDVDSREIGKNKEVHIGVQADLRRALPQLLEVAASLDSAEWLAYLQRAGRQRPLASAPPTHKLTGPVAISQLAARLPATAVIATGVGQHQMWAMQYLRPHRQRSFLSSSGFGTMGFGLPAAIGAKVAMPEATVIDIDGDGSLNMTINELSTCHRYRLGVKVFVVNNQWLGMVRQWQDLIYAGNRVASSLEDVSDGTNRGPYPDFVAIACGYRVTAERVDSVDRLDVAIARMLADPAEPYLVDVIVERESNVFPMIPSGKTYRDVIFDGDEASVEDT